MPLHNNKKKNVYLANKINVVALRIIDMIGNIWHTETPIKTWNMSLKWDPQT